MNLRFATIPSQAALADWWLFFFAEGAPWMWLGSTMEGIIQKRGRTPMLHPDTRLQWINSYIGYGVFATAFIPKGTIVYVQDALDIVIPPDSPLLDDARTREWITKYATIEPDGKRLLCWDIAKYVNHCCHYNALSTAYGFEFAVRDIHAGEEMTDDYGLFNMEQEMKLGCHYQDCRQVLRVGDFDLYSQEWDAVIKRTLPELLNVPQPLLNFLDTQMYADLMNYLTSGQGYKSVQTLKYVSREQEV
jgi:hypothetical protein